MKRFAIPIVAMLAAVPAGGQAQSGSGSAPEDNLPNATERLQEGAAAIVEGLQLLIEQLNSYQAPEVTPNGDIIIRRRPPETAEPPSDEASPEANDGKSLKL